MRREPETFVEALAELSEAVAEVGRLVMATAAGRALQRCADWIAGRPWALRLLHAASVAYLAAWIIGGAIWSSCH